MDDLKAWKVLALDHQGITMALAEFVASMRERPLPARTRGVLREALVDAIGCGLYGLTTDWARIIHDFAREQRGLAESGLWCGGERINSAQAAAMSKRIHPGKAAHDGINAALLAAKGFQGPRYILEAADGSFLFTMSDSPRPWMITEGLGSRWHSDETCFKPHACCGSNHACVDAAIELAVQERVDIADVERIIAGIADVVRTQTGFAYRADSVLNAQMSLQYNVAVALHDRQAYLEQFTPQRVVDPAVCETASRVEIEVDPEIDRAYPEVYGGRLTLVLKNGRRLSKRVDYSRGMPENPMSGEEIERKFRSLAAAAVGRPSTDQILVSARELFEASSAMPLADLLTAARLVRGETSC